MNYKWSAETFRKTEALCNGETHDYSGERYWIDVVATSGIHIDIVLKKVVRDNGAPKVSGCFRVNDIVVKRWEAPTLQEAAELGENLINAMKASISTIN